MSNGDSYGYTLDAELEIICAAFAAGFFAGFAMAVWAMVGFVATI